ncbi:EamA family transporter [Candidatus Saccharibacteria bacterium]|nr:MAG: EamA family transporter [Candidatus Saccharibacteria bacterium]
MWFALALLALCMLVVRRSVEKGLTKNIDSLALTWMQQAFALPFIAVSLVLMPFYWPQELSGHFWFWTSLYAVCGALDLFLYFKALSLADVSHVAPLISLTGIGVIAGSVVILHQQPTIVGITGAVLIVIGATVVHRDKQKHTQVRRQNTVALWLILGVVVLRAIYGNTELFPLREANATTFNLYSSLLTVPLLLMLAVLLKARTAKTYWKATYKNIKLYLWPLLFVGLTYTVNLTATYQAKLLAPTVGYVTSVKSAQVVPMMLIGAWLFREKVSRKQWYGVGLISVGLPLLSFG